MRGEAVGTVCGFHDGHGAPEVEWGSKTDHVKKGDLVFTHPPSQRELEG